MAGDFEIQREKAVSHEEAALIQSIQNSTHSISADLAAIANLVQEQTTVRAWVSQLCEDVPLQQGTLKYESERAESLAEKLRESIEECLKLQNTVAECMQEIEQLQTQA